MTTYDEIVKTTKKLSRLKEDLEKSIEITKGLELQQEVYIEDWEDYDGPSYYRNIVIDKDIERGRVLLLEPSINEIRWHDASFITLKKELK